MAKKASKKKSTRESHSKNEINQALIDNFINLQKVLTNLAVKFDDLSNNMSKMLQLFEISAKSFAEKYEGEGGRIDRSDQALLAKLDSLLDQNKTIAKGILLMEDKIRQREPRHSLAPESTELRPRPLPRL